MSCGAYIAFEGVDAAGKSTQAALLAKRLDAMLTFEPGGTELGKQIRSMLLSNSGEAPTDTAEALLFAADRAQHLALVVAPTMAAGRHVVADRSYGSTLAYQGYGRQIAIERIWELIAWSSQITSRALAQAAREQARFGFPDSDPELGVAGKRTTAEPLADQVLLLPDVVVLLDVPIDKDAYQLPGEPDRFEPDGTEPDRIEKESQDFRHRVAAGYRSLATQDKRRWVQVNALGTPAEVEQRVLEALAENEMFERIVAGELRRK